MLSAWHPRDRVHTADAGAQQPPFRRNSRTRTADGGHVGSEDSALRARADESDCKDANFFCDSTGSARGSPSGRAIAGRRVAFARGQWSTDLSTYSDPRTRRRAAVRTNWHWLLGLRTSSELRVPFIQRVQTASQLGRTARNCHHILLSRGTPRCVAPRFAGHARQAFFRTQPHPSARNIERPRTFRRRLYPFFHRTISNTQRGH